MNMYPKYMVMGTTCRVDSTQPLSMPANPGMPVFMHVGLCGDTKRQSGDKNSLTWARKHRVRRRTEGSQLCSKPTLVMSSLV